MIIEIIFWLESHDKLAGWAQFFGAMLALIVTYFTAFFPLWERKRRLHGSAKRLLSNGYEVIESYHRTSAHFEPIPLSLRQASLSMSTVVDEIHRFPIYELSKQNRNSLARRLGAMSLNISFLRLYIDTFAIEIEGRKVTQLDRENLKDFLEQRLHHAQLLVLGREIERPVPPK